MELSVYFRSIVEQDTSPVVICNLDHIIIYMNPAAQDRYAGRGGAGLVGRSLLDCHGPQSVEQIKRVTAWFGESAAHNVLYTFRSEKENKDVFMVALRDENGTLIGYYEKHEYRTPHSGETYQFA